MTDSSCYYGAGNRGRTDTVFPPRDFKSLASAYSAIPAKKNYCVSIVVRCNGKSFGNTVCKQNALLHILLRPSNSVNNKIATRAKFERNYRTTPIVGQWR